MTVVAGAGAFGTALAIAMARAGRPVTLWSRDRDQARAMAATRANERRLPGQTFPEGLTVTADPGALQAGVTVLLAMPMQAMAGFLAHHGAALDGKALVACAKGIDLARGIGPSAVIATACPAATVAVLTGPSFAADIAAGLPTALTLACRSDEAGADLQAALATPALRLYRTDDVTGAELGGALKNVVAIGAGVVGGANLGDSARAALMTRGFAEMVRLAVALGARAETLAGLSGLGDLVLTCTSPQSRNFRFGHAVGAGRPPEPGVTVEGKATVRAALGVAAAHGVEVPVMAMVAALIDGRLGPGDAVDQLLARPLKRE